MWFSDVDVLYCPMQVERTHWVGVVIDLPRWMISVLDCNTRCLTPDQVTKYVEHAVVMLHFLIRKHGGNKLLKGFSLEPFAMERPYIPFLIEAPGLTGIASIVLLELHAVENVGQCDLVREEELHAAAKNYVIETFEAFNPTILPD